MATTPGVVVAGQVWADTRVRGRTVRVDRVDSTMAHCTVITMGEQTEYRVGHKDPWYRDLTGMSLAIRLYRFRGAKPNYELLSEPGSMNPGTGSDDGTGD